MVAAPMVAAPLLMAAIGIATAGAFSTPPSPRSLAAPPRAAAATIRSRPPHKRGDGSSSFSPGVSTGALFAAATPSAGIETTTPTNRPESLPPTSERYDSVVVGAGPAGLLTAIMLAQKFPTQRVSVYDRLPSPPSPTDSSTWSDVARFYLIGLGHRGQAALKRFGAWDEVEAVSAPVVGRKDWTPGAKPEEGVERLATDKPTTTMVLPRDKLVGVLHEHILDNYADRVRLNYEYQVVPLDFGDDDGEGEGSSGPVRLGVSKCAPSPDDDASTRLPTVASTPQAACDVDEYAVVESNFVVGCDGAARTIANAMEERDAERIEGMNPLRRALAGKPFKVKRFEDDNKRVYKTVPVRVPKDWRFDLNYSARSRGSRITFEALPSDDRGTYCALLLMRPDDEFARPNVDNASKLRQFFDHEFPQFGALIDDETLRGVAAKPYSNLPAFRYAGPRLHHGRRTVLLGDAIHTVKPYYGLGANTALEDVSVLADSFDEAESKSGEGEGGGVDSGSTVRLFSKKRAREANSVVTISRNMDRPGRLGTAAFVVPLILDGIFHKLAPALFAPNMFAMFQREGMAFRAMQRRKRQDRAVQLALVGCVLAGIAAGVRAAVSLIARAVGRSDAFVGGVGVAMAALLASLKKVMASSSSQGKEEEEGMRPSAQQ